MKLLDVPLGLLINFHEMKVTDGVETRGEIDLSCNGYRWPEH
jgi:hypothetical protein